MGTLPDYIIIAFFHLNRYALRYKITLRFLIHLLRTTDVFYQLPFPRIIVKDFSKSWHVLRVAENSIEKIQNLYFKPLINRQRKTQILEC